MRDEVHARFKTLNLLERVATIPPLITPIRDAQGEIRDAKAEQVSSLDEYIEAVERESDPVLPG